MTNLFNQRYQLTIHSQITLPKMHSQFVNLEHVRLVRLSDSIKIGRESNVECTSYNYSKLCPQRNTLSTLVEKLTDDDPLFFQQV